MRGQMSYRSGNPSLNSKTFQNLERPSDSHLLRDDVMTIQGTVDKTGISLALLIFAGYFAYVPDGFIFMISGGLGGLIVAIVTIYKKTWAPITVPLYAILEGLFLGSISYMYGQMYEGIVLNAIILTVSILASLLLVYKSGYIKVTENFKLGVAAATGGIALVYLFSIFGSFFGINISFLDPNNGSLISIGASLFIVIIASLNLVMDFDFIEKGAEKRVPKYMEWFGAFGLLVTLVWLYLEILRLLSKLNSRK
ncbi:Bax inhibitor-1/YccA family protein [bacterium]|nr:Bax inhibitor-1/YccA family protein [bacterium]